MEKKSSPNLPVWATDYFEAGLDRLNLLHDILEISQAGLSGLRGFPRLIEVLAKAKKIQGHAKAGNDQTESYEEQLETAKRHAQLAQSEVENGFSTLNGFGVMALSSWLESFMLDLVVLWVAKRPSSLREYDGPRIRMNVGDLFRLKGTEKARFVVEQIDRETSGPFRAGFARFEHLLRTAQLEVKLEKEHKDALFEFHQVRNCLAHRHGYGDKKLRSECPWLNIKVGEPIPVTREMLAKYFNASSALLAESLFAAGDQFKVDLRDT